MRHTLPDFYRCLEELFDETNPPRRYSLIAAALFVAAPFIGLGVQRRLNQPNRSSGVTRSIYPRTRYRRHMAVTSSNQRSCDFWPG